MTVLGLIALVVIVCLIGYLLTKISAPPPFNWVIPLVIVLVLIFFLFSLLGVGHGFGLNTPLR